MNRWIAITMTADHRTGGRFYIMEAMYSPGYARPPYAAGDIINLEATDMGQIGGTVEAVTKTTLDAAFADGTRLQFSPTPPTAPPASFASEIPFHDMMGKPIDPVSE